MLSVADRQFLQAALLKGPAAAKAFRLFLGGGHTLQTVSYPYQRLFPQLYYNLRDSGALEGDEGTLKGVWRYTMARNGVLGRATAPVLQAWQDQGLQVLLVGAAGLLHIAYGNNGLRTLDGIDVAIPRADLGTAVSTLQQLGWTGPYRDTWTGPEGHRITLWDEVIRYSVGANHAESWNSSVPIDWYGVSTRTLCATDALLHLCACRREGFDWIADVAALMPKIDWPAMQACLDRHDLTAPTQQALAVVCSLGLAVAAQQVRTNTLAKIRYAHRVRTRPIRLWLADYGNFVRSERLGPAGAVLQIPEFLRRRWKLGRRRDVLWALLLWRTDRS